MRRSMSPSFMGVDEVEHQEKGDLNKATKGDLNKNQELYRVDSSQTKFAGR